MDILALYSSSQGSHGALEGVKKAQNVSSQASDAIAVTVEYMYIFTTFWVVIGIVN